MVIESVVFQTRLVHITWTIVEFYRSPASTLLHLNTKNQVSGLYVTTYSLSVLPEITLWEECRS